MMKSGEMTEEHERVMTFVTNGTRGVQAVLSDFSLDACACTY